MRGPISISILVIFLGSSMAIAAPPVRQTENVRCAYPDPYKLLGPQMGGFVDQMDYRFEESPVGPIRWVFFSWAAPPDGWVFVIACDGHVLAQRALGYIHKLDTGPLLDGNMSVEAVYVPDSGTGIRDESVAVLRFDGQTISVVWDHATDNEGTFPNDTWAHGRPGDYRLRTEIDRYQWTYAHDGAEIHVTGKHTVELGGRTRTRALPTEKYCFRSAANKYVRCR